MPRLTPQIILDKIRLHSSALLLCLGIIAMGIWMDLVGHSPVFIPTSLSGNTSPEFTLTRYGFYSGVIVCGILLIILGNKLEPLFKEHAGRFIPTTALIMSLGTIIFSISYVQNVVNPFLIAVSACFITGACYNIFIFALYVNLALSENIKVAISAVAASLIIRSFFSRASGWLDSPIASLCIGGAVPILVTLLLWHVIRLMPPPPQICRVPSGAGAQLSCRLDNYYGLLLYWHQSSK